MPDTRDLYKIYKRSTRSGKLCIPCAFFWNGETLTPEEAFTEKLCDKEFLDSIAHLQPKDEEVVVVEEKKVSNEDEVVAQDVPQQKE